MCLKSLYFLLVLNLKSTNAAVSIKFKDVTLGFYSFQHYIMKMFKDTEKLEKLYSKLLYTHHLEAAVNIVLCFHNHVSVHLFTYHSTLFLQCISK